MLVLTFFFVIVFLISPCVIDRGRISSSGDYFLINDVITVACVCEGYREVPSLRLVHVLSICAKKTGFVCGAV